MSSSSERAQLAFVTLRGAAIAATAISLHTSLAGVSHAQDGAPSPAELPPVTVSTGSQSAAKKANTTTASTQAEGSIPGSSSPSAGQKNRSPIPPQDRNDPGTTGFVATQIDAATKSSASVLETPRSVSIVTKAEIEERDAESVYEAVQYSSGVNAYPFSGNFITREQAHIRGFLAYQFLDGLKQHDSNWGIEPYGLERIDILKGPASMLYGQGSPGGLIDLTSKRPTEDPFAEVVLKVGTHEKLQAGFDFGGPVGHGGVLSYRLTGMGRMSDGEVDFTENNRVYLAPAFTFRPSADTSFTLLGSYQYDPDMTVQQPLPFEGTVVPGANGQYISRNLFLGEPGYHDTSKRSYKIGYELHHRFNDVLSFEQNAAYRRIDISLEEIQGLGAVSGTSTLRQMFLAEYVIDTYQADTRLRAEFVTGPIAHNVIFGFDYSNIPNYQGAGVAVGSTYFPLNLYNPVYGQALTDNPLIQRRYQEFEQSGLYVLDTMTLENLTVVAGLRHDWANSAQQTQRLNTSTGKFTNPAYVPKGDEATTVQLGASYQLPGGVAPYISYSESFFPATGTDFFGNAFDPTTGEQYEAGLKYQPFGTNALFTAVLFDLTQQNVFTADPAHPGYRVQTDEVSAKGAEFEVRASLASGWNVAAAYTYLDSEVTSTGLWPVYLPKHQAAAWASYTFTEGELDGFTLGGGMRYFGDTFGDRDNTFKVPAFTLYDATVRYDLGVISPAYENWEVSLNVKNLTDERYVTNCEAYTSCYYGAGRTVDAALRMRF